MAITPAIIPAAAVTVAREEAAGKAEGHDKQKHGRQDLFHTT
jgi:hypothetical protein